MKFFLFFVFIALVAWGVLSPEIRKSARALIARVWAPLLLAAAIAIAFWVAAYGGDSIRLF